MLSLGTHRKWPLRSLDARNAFLSGDASRRRPLYVRLPNEWCQELQWISTDCFVWFKTLTRVLNEVGFRQSWSDACCFTLPATESDMKEWRRQRSMSKAEWDRVPQEDRLPENLDVCPVLGVLGIHVDDILLLGFGRRFHEHMRRLQERLPFESLKSGSLTFTGVELNQTTDGTIYASQKRFAAKLTDLSKNQCVFQRNGVIDRRTETTYRAVVGAQLRLSVQTRPDLAFDVSYYAGLANKATWQTVPGLNKVVRHAKTDTDAVLCYKKLAARWSDLRQFGFSDAGQGSRSSGMSQAGSLVLLGQKAGLDGYGVSGNITEARSEKIPRACRSSFRGELEALQATADLMEATGFQIEDICKGCDPATWLETYGDKEHARALIIDSKGLYNGLKHEKKPTPTGERGRLATWILLRQSLTSLRAALYWVNSDHELADC